MLAFRTVTYCTENEETPFSQRYRVAEEEVTASVAVSTALGLVTMPVVILAVTRWVVG